MDDSGKRENGAGEETAPKKKAEDNPWYLLATLYGVPGKGDDDELRKKNRIAWNRYFAASLNGETRTKLSEEKRHPEQELRPFWPQELREVEAAYDKRRGSKTLELPSSDVRIDFSNVEFDRDVIFEQFLFCYCSFQKAYFSCEAWFPSANFFGACFVGVKFFDKAWFTGATFSGGTNFGGATFSGRTMFSDATFSGKADFRGAKFLRTSSFVNAEMKGETSFKNATFETEPPTFFEAKLHEGTNWNPKKWPLPPTANAAEEFVSRYACLKREMDRLKKHEDELDFFALELQSRRVKHGPVCGFPIAIYGFLSDYGRSYVWPFVWLIAVAAFGAAFFFHFGALPLGEASGLSAANTFNVFGFRKDFIATSVIVCLSPWLEVVAAIQTILGTILLFLFGLGVRNKFRMK
jgi:hypothetical protein